MLLRIILIHLTYLRININCHHTILRIGFVYDIVLYNVRVLLCSHAMYFGDLREVGE